MDHTLRIILEHIVSPLIVAAFTGGFAWMWAKEHQRKKIDAAPREFVNELDKLISRAYFEGPDKAMVNARAIVAARNSLAAPLARIQIQLNSEIDRLAEEVGEIFEKLHRSVERREPADARAVYETIEVLVRMWPAKKKQIEVEIRSVLAVLGLDIRSAGLDIRSPES
jgi:hypothetical protein